MIYTSGSTGRPKGAVLTQKSILAMIRPWAANLMLKNEDRLLLVLPLNHVGGGTICAMTSLASGATSVMHDMFLPDIALSLIDEQKITILAGVPTMYAMIFSLPSFDKRTLNSVRTAVYGGAAAPPELLNKMNTLMICRIIGTYGSTEVSGFCTYTTAEDSFDTVLTTVGKPPKSINIKIVDPVSRAALNTGQIGEVAIKGDLLIDRYLNMPEETRLVFDNEGWFFSGDMGCLNQEGYLTLAGRLKEMYITGGFNVYPKEIEDILAEHPAVAMAAVIGVPDDIKGETGWAFVMKVPGSNVTVDDLTKYCKEKMANYKVPSKIFIEDTLPMTSLGKVHKPTLKELYGKIS
jgi:fatty-acyl-CoA synthase